MSDDRDGRASLTFNGERAVNLLCRLTIILVGGTIALWPPNPSRHIQPAAPRPRPSPGQKTPGLSTRARGATAPLLAALAASFPTEISLLAF
jgi:hypothetical protein